MSMTGRVDPGGPVAPDRKIPPSGPAGAGTPEVAPLTHLFHPTYNFMHNICFFFFTMSLRPVCYIPAHPPVLGWLYVYPVLIHTKHIHIAYTKPFLICCYYTILLCPSSFDKKNLIISKNWPH